MNLFQDNDIQKFEKYKRRNQRLYTIKYLLRRLHVTTLVIKFRIKIRIDQFTNGQLFSITKKGFSSCLPVVYKL